MEDKEYPCPLCNTKTDWRFECPGYGPPGHIMVCMPCSNAVEYYCTNRECEWWHRTPNNRGDITKMGVAPTWLAEALAEFEVSEDERA